jgi:hydroxyacylglutathione hydrolase
VWDEKILGYGRTMKIIPLRQTGKKFRCTPYLILGSRNRLPDIITVIDPGPDEIILDEIDRVTKDLGTVLVSQVIITHNNVEHAGGCRALKKRYNAKIRAFSAGSEIDEPLLKDGQFIEVGNDVFEVLHTPGYSPDSICLYAPSEKTLFSGDLRVTSAMSGEPEASEYIQSLLKIACRDIEAIYASHDEPVMRWGQDIILQTMERLAAESKKASLTRVVHA